MLGDIRLRGRQNAAREYIPSPAETADLRQQNSEVMPYKSRGFEPRPMPATASWAAVAASLVGYRTASGKILDTVTATAAHRSLSLASLR